MASVPLVAGGCVYPFARRTYPILTGIGQVALSPDGRIVAAIYKDDSSVSENRGRDHQLVLFDWRSGEVTWIPHPSLPRLDNPQFSRDGRELTVARRRMATRHDGEVVLSNDIARIDLRTFEMRPATSDGGSKQFYSLSYDRNGQRLALLWQDVVGGRSGIGLIERSGTAVREVLDSRFAFYSLADLCFVGSEDLLFQARSPRHPALASQVTSLGFRSTDNMQYRLRLVGAASGGAEPEILVPQLDSRGRTFPIGRICASADSAVLAWTARSLTDADGRGRFNYEVFERRAGRVTQVTHLATYSQACAISGDGNTIAFTESPERTFDFDLTILDRGDRRVIRTDLLRRLRATTHRRYGRGLVA